MFNTVTNIDTQCVKMGKNSDNFLEHVQDRDNLVEKNDNYQTQIDNFQSVLDNLNKELDYRKDTIDQQRKEIRKQKLLKLAGFTSSIILPILTLLALL